VTTSRRTSRRPTLEQVAARAGASRATVSRVVNGFASVDAALRERVEAAVAELGYVPNAAARTLVTRRTDTIALVASEPDERVFGDPFFGDVVRGVSQEAMRAGLHTTLLMAQSWTDLDLIERYLLAAPIDGVLLVSEHATHDPLPAALLRAGVPVVIGGRPLRPGLVVPSVDNDNVGGARAAARHLAEAGRTTVGTVAGPSDMAAGIDRLAGLRAGLGRRFRAARVERGDFTTEGGEAATARLLERVPDLDGLFVANDLMAVGALRGLRLAGRRVPDDVAVVGFDDAPIASMTDPPLTTVRQDTVLQGRVMVRMLIARTRPGTTQTADDGLPDVMSSDQVVLPVELVVRSSS
jgi:DNA-binding LacI/PurR family transcriptional regulator